MTVFTDYETERLSRRTDRAQNSDVRQLRLCRRLSGLKRSLSEAGYAGPAEVTKFKKLAARCGETPDEIDDFLDRLVVNEPPIAHADREHSALAMTAQPA